MTQNLPQHQSKDISPSVEIQICVAFPNAEQARASVKALIPDNVNMPEGLKIEMSSKGKIIHIGVTGQSIAIATVTSTIDEILAHLSIASKVMMNPDD